MSIKKLNRIFDFKGPSGFIPNGSNHYFYNDFWENSYSPHNDFINQFNKKYIQISVYDCTLNLPSEFLNDIHVNDVYYNEEEKFVNDKSELYVYSISPYGNVNICTGHDFAWHQNRHCFDFISKSVKDMLDAENFYIVFDYSSEGDIQPFIFENLHKACKDNGIREDKVIIITAASNTYDIYYTFLKESNTQTKFKTACYNWPILAKSRELNGILTSDGILHFNGHRNLNTVVNKDSILDFSLKEKKCLNLNRRLKPHRLIVLSALIHDKLIDDTLSSFDIKMGYHRDMGLDLVNGSGHDDEPYMKSQSFKNDVLDGFRKLKKLEKRTLDYNDLDSVWGLSFETKELYEKTFFSVVSESLFFEYGNYISEKTLKPIMHYHPFVMVGRPHTLKILKEIGFKTFSDFWDESYDEIEDNSIRIETVYNLIKKLILLDNKEWESMYVKMYNILVHNRNLLLKLDGRNIYARYYKNLIKIIENEHNQKNNLLLQREVF